MNGVQLCRNPALCIIISDIWLDKVVLTTIRFEQRCLFCSHRSEKWDTESQKTERTNAHASVVCHVTATLHTLRGAMCHEVTYRVKHERGRESGEGKFKKRPKGKDKCKKKKGRSASRGSAADDTESCSISEPDSHNK